MDTGFWKERIEEKQLKFRHLYPRFGKGFTPDIAIGRGWDNLVLELDKKLNEIDPNYQIHQIKTKFGGLRFYASMSEEQQQGRFDIFYKNRFNKLIADAQDRSFTTCEWCGDPGVNIDESGWLYTLCVSCKKDRT